MAAVDVYESEPVLPGPPLLRMENCLCTPHIGYVEEESYELYFNTAFDSVLGFIAGNPVNPAASFVARRISETSLPAGPTSDSPSGAPSREASGSVTCGKRASPARQSRLIELLR